MPTQTVEKTSCSIPQDCSVGPLQWTPGVPPHLLHPDDQGLSAVPETALLPGSPLLPGP